MRKIKKAFLGALALLIGLWLITEPSVFGTTTFFGLRDAMIQLTGVMAIGCMSMAMVLALRPRWPESWLGGLDKMYRLHKWLGIAALVLGIVHWLWSQGPKWAVGLGWLGRPVRGERPQVQDPLEAFFLSLRSPAEGVGEWAFYAAVLLIVLALIRYFPYRLFYKTHRLLAVAYLVLVFHTVVLTKVGYWTSPVGPLLVVLLASGTWAAVIVLLGRIGVDRQVKGRIASLHYYLGVKTLETEIDVPQGWPGHKPGQFAFATSDVSEGAHPYTIASGWHAESPRIAFIIKELGDHTRRLRDKLSVGKEVKIEGPYGCFTFDDNRPNQIWIGGGIGITPFIARMKHMRLQKDAPDWPVGQSADLFHSTSDVDEDALDKLATDAQSVNIRLHVLLDARDGRLTGERIREAVPNWREASIWFCGPAGFGEALRKDFAAHDFPVEDHFHQEFFAMR